MASNLLANQALRNNSADAISIIENLEYSSDLYEEIVYRYLKYIESNKQESNLIKLMISIGMFKKEDIQELISAYNLEINMLDFDEIIERLIDFKFISNVYQDKNNDDYTDEIYEIDKLIRNYLINIRYPRKHKDYGKSIINTDYKNAALNYLSRKLVNYGHKEEFYIKQIIQLIDSLGIENKSEALRLKREKYFKPYLEFLKNEKDYDEVLRLLILIINSENKCQIDGEYNLYKFRYLYWNSELEDGWKATKKEYYEIFHDNSDGMKLELVYFMKAIVHSLIERNFKENWSRDVFLKKYKLHINWLKKGVEDEDF